MKSRSNTFLLAPAHLTGIGAIQLFLLLLYLFNIYVALLPIVLFLLITFIAPFFPGSKYFLPVISHGNRKENKVSLTFDDGPDPIVTTPLLDLLDKHDVKACFFVIGKKGEKHSELMFDIINRGHEIGNHSYDHSPFIMFFSKAKLLRDIKKTQDIISAYNIYPLCFRPPRGNTNPRLWSVLHKLSLSCVNFNNRAKDFGNRRLNKLSDKILKKLKNGDIILLHDTYAKNLSLKKYLDEIDKLITGIKNRKIQIVKLSENIKLPVLASNKSNTNNAVSSFYNNLAKNYDKEQFYSAVSVTRTREIQIIDSFINNHITSNMNVLEIGSGTGILTERISKKAKYITALDVSEGMLKILKEKIRKKQHKNIEIVNETIENYVTKKKFNLICSFSSFEYITDLETVFDNIYTLLDSKGTLYFTTAHTSFLKFFAQIGNAMRQGIWLRARRKAYIYKILEKKGFQNIEINIHIAGILLEVKANKL